MKEVRLVRYKKKMENEKRLEMICESCNFKGSIDDFPELNSEEGQKIYKEKIPDLLAYSQLFFSTEKKGLFIVGISQYICPNCGACWMCD